MDNDITYITIGKPYLHLTPVVAVGYWACDIRVNGQRLNASYADNPKSAKKMARYISRDMVENWLCFGFKNQPQIK